MRRIARWFSLGLVAAASLAVGDDLPGPRAASAATSPTLRTCSTYSGPAWQQGAESGTRWVFVASEGLLCRDGRHWVNVLAPRIASTGTVDVQRFASGTWSCLTGRSLGLGFCTSREGGTARTLFVTTDSRQGQALRDALRAGGTSSVLGPLVGNGSASGGTIDLDGEEPLLPSPCTARPGSRWSRTAPDGDMWLSYAGGGITCLAAQGWVIDVSARMPVGTTPRQFEGGDSWHCIAGPNASSQGTRIGACARRANWRTSLEPRFSVIAGGVTMAVRSGLTARGYDQAIWEIAGASAPSFSLPQRCGHKGVVWHVGGVAGNRWLVGTSGGYPCPVASAAAAKLLARTESRTSDTTMLKGVRDAWRCHFVASTRTTTCTWNGVARVPSGRRALKLVFTPERTGGAAIVTAALAP